MQTKKINKSYKIRCYPTKKQRDRLAIEFGCSRFVWNFALAYKRFLVAGILPKNDEWIDLVCHLAQSEPDKFEFLTNKNKKCWDFNKLFVQLKKTEQYKWLSNASSDVIVNKLRDLDNAYSRFFMKQAKHPKFKKKTNKQSIRYATSNYNNRFEKNFQINHGFIKLPKLGKLKLRGCKKLVIGGLPKQVTLTKMFSGKYYISFMISQEIVIQQRRTNVVGLDFGIKDLITTSDGNKFKNLRTLDKLSKQLKRAQQSLNRKVKNSKNREKQRIKVAKIHERIVNIRTNYLHHITSQLVDQYDVIGVESLDIKRMMHKSRFAGSISDASWFAIKTMIRYKSDWSGGIMIEVDQYFPSSQQCSCCGKINKEIKDLSIRLWQCECGAVHDRDINAAQNIKREAIKLIGGEHRPGSEKNEQPVERYSADSSSVVGTQSRILNEAGINQRSEHLASHSVVR